ncbi:MAG: porin family protein [Chromatiales bacterium]|nr:porin family protein [Chromatiales bacterium]
MKKIILLLALVFPVISTAESYLGLGGGIGSIQESGIDDAFLTYVYGGHQFNEYLSLEIAYMKSASFSATGDRVFDPLNQVFNVNNDKIYGEAWIPSLSLHYIENNWKLFALIGNAFWQARTNDEGVGVNDEDTDFAYGLGIEYRPAKWGLRAEWRRLEIDWIITGETELDAFLISLNRYF